MTAPARETKRDCQDVFTKHLRKLVGKEGIAARVRKLANSSSGIQVFPAAHDQNFSEIEQRFIRNVAKVNGLTLVRGLEIDVERMTDPNGMEFHISNERAARYFEVASQFDASGRRKEVA